MAIVQLNEELLNYVSHAFDIKLTSEEIILTNDFEEYVIKKSEKNGFDIFVMDEDFDGNRITDNDLYNLNVEEVIEYLLRGI